MRAAVALGVALLLMLAEQRRSRRHELALRRAGATEPAGDVYRPMAWVYPASFVAMAAEGAWRDGAAALVGAGIVVFAAAKFLKYWAIASLGPRWTFRVLVPPGVRLVSAGPYRWLRHPNYVGVVAELVGFAVLVGAPATGLLSTVTFAWLLRRRIAVEERALAGRAPST